MITCFIRYQIDPFQRDAFEIYAQNWGRIIPRCGGHPVTHAASGSPVVVHHCHRTLIDNDLKPGAA